LLLTTTTVSLTLEPALSLVLLALTLSGVAVVWILLLARLLLLEARGKPDARPHCVLPARDDSAMPVRDATES